MNYKCLNWKRNSCLIPLQEQPLPRELARYLFPFRYSQLGGGIARVLFKLCKKATLKMLLIFGSICTLVATVIFCSKPRQHWLLLLTKIIYEFKYNLVALKDLVHYIRYVKQNEINLPQRSGHVAIVTGGSRGIGAMVVNMLLQCDMEVIIACRKIAAGEKIVELIRQSGVNTGKAKVYELDNSSLQSVREFAIKIKRDYLKINILVNNAGIMFTPYTETKDGFEHQWAVNYLSHFLLSSLLLPLLNAGGSSKEKSRIVNVSSCAHVLGYINFCDTNYRGQFVTSVAYAQSKLAQVMFSTKLQDLISKRMLPIEIFSVHPGLVNTELFNNTYVGRLKWFTRYLFKTVEQGAIPIMYAAVSKDIEGHGGIYISNCNTTSMSPQALDTSVQEQLFNLSLKQVNLQDFFQHMQ